MSKVDTAEKAADMRIRSHPIQWMPRFKKKQDVPAWLVSAMEYQDRKVVLRKDRITCLLSK